MKPIDVVADIVHGYETAFKKWPTKCAFAFGAFCALGAYGIAAFNPVAGGIAAGGLVLSIIAAWKHGKPKLNPEPKPVPKPIPRKGPYP